MSKINDMIRRKVKFRPGTTFYEPGGDNTGVITCIKVLRTSTIISVSDGCTQLGCYAKELRYLNNKPVVLP